LPICSGNRTSEIIATKCSPARGGRTPSAGAMVRVRMTCSFRTRSADSRRCAAHSSPAWNAVSALRRAGMLAKPRITNSQSGWFSTRNCPSDTAPAATSGAVSRLSTSDRYLSDLNFSVRMSWNSTTGQAALWFSH